MKLMYGNNKYILYIVLRLMKIFLVIALLVPVLVMGAKVKPGPTPVPNNTVTNATYPVRFAYINRINSWWPPEAIAAGLGVPGYAPATIYNYIAFAFWTYSGGPVDIVKLWSDPITYFGSSSVFGSTKLAIQQNIKKKYNDNGIKLLISAFGATQFPTTAGIDPVLCANKLADFVKNNNLDGVDIDWEDNTAMNNGVGMSWIVTFQKTLRTALPSHIITHAPQAPYFNQQIYNFKSYIEVHQQVGSGINFYNIQFYNQGNNAYNTYTTLFQASGGYFVGTSVIEIRNKGVPSNKIVVGKPVTQADLSNTGWVDPVQLGNWVNQAYTKYTWYGGVMFWQYQSDVAGNAIQSAAGSLVSQCTINKNCL